jgi:hypothetical protein
MGEHVEKGAKAGESTKVPVANSQSKSPASDWQKRYGLALELAKIAALLFAGVWTLFTYLTVQRNFSDPTTPSLVSTAVLETRAPETGDEQAIALVVKHQNLGKVDVRITHAVIRLFYGKLNGSAEDSVVILNGPPPIGSERGATEDVPIKWGPVSYKACVTPSIVTGNPTVKMPTDFEGYIFQAGGDCGTGVIRAGASLVQEFSLRYRAGASAYVGVAAAFTFDNGTAGESPRVTHVSALAEAAPGGVSAQAKDNIQ